MLSKAASSDDAGDAGDAKTHDDLVRLGRLGSDQGQLLSPVLSHPQLRQLRELDGRVAKSPATWLRVSVHGDG